jgi:hypothetical protein
VSGHSRGFGCPNHDRRCDGQAKGVHWDSPVDHDTLDRPAASEKPSTVARPAGSARFGGRFGDHGVDEHDQQGAAGESVDAGLQVAARHVGGAIAKGRCQPADNRDRDPQAQDEAACASFGAQFGRRAD